LNKLGTARYPARGPAFSSHLRAEAKEGDGLARALRDLNALPLRFYCAEETVEAAAAELAEFARRSGRHAVLFIDSLQTCRCDRDDSGESAYVNVSARVAAIRRVATKYAMLLVVTSEMGRGSYRSRNSADQTNDMAAAKESGATEYSARVLLSLRTVAGSPDIAELRIIKNKHGPRTPDGERGILLRLDAAGQHFRVADAHEVPAEEVVDEKAVRAATEAAAKVATWLAAHPGEGTRDVYGGLLARDGLGRGRVDNGMAVLRNAEALVIRPGPGREHLHFLIGENVPDDGLAKVPASRRPAVRAAVLPTEPAGSATAEGGSR